MKACKWTDGLAPLIPNPGTGWGQGSASHPLRVTPGAHSTEGRCLTNKGESKGKRKGKVHPRTGHEGPEGEYRYSSTLSLTSTLDGVGGQRHDPAALPPGKTRYPTYRKLGGPQCSSERVRKPSPPPGFDPRTVQPVASRYTDCAIPV